MISTRISRKEIQSRILRTLENGLQFDMSTKDSNKFLRRHVYEKVKLAIIYIDIYNSTKTFNHQQDHTGFRRDTVFDSIRNVIGHWRHNGRYEHGVSGSDILPLKLPDEDDYSYISEHPGFNRWRY
jgi:hypothetical protein